MGLKTLILVCPFILLTISCGKSQEIPNSPSDNFLKVIWETPITDLGFTTAMSPILFNEYVVTSTSDTFQGHHNPILFLDSSTGQVEHLFSNYQRNPVPYYEEKVCAFEQYLLLRDRKSIQCLNMESKQLQWYSDLKDSGPWIYAHQGYVYTSIDYNNYESAAIIRSPVSSENWDTVFAFTINDDYLTDFGAIGFGEAGNGDQIMVWKNRSWKSTSPRTDIFAYNLSADTLMWRNTDLEVNSGIIPLKIKDDKVFGLVNSHAFAMDLQNGRTLWLKNLRELFTPTLDISFFSGDFYLEDDLMIIKGDSDELVTLYAASGLQKSILQDYGYNFSGRFSYFEGKLFFGSDGLRIINAYTGENLINERQREQFGNIKEAIEIDPLRRVMYFNDGRFNYCVKIPEGI